MGNYNKIIMMTILIIITIIIIIITVGNEKYIKHFSRKRWHGRNL